MVIRHLRIHHGSVQLNCAIDLASGPVKDKIIINTCPSHVPKIIPLGI